MSGMCTHILSAVSYVCVSRVRFVLSVSSPCRAVYLFLKILRSFKILALQDFLHLAVLLMIFANNTPEWKMSRPWTRSMPNQPEEVFGTQTSNNFTQGQSSQQDSEAALSQVCRLFEQSQQQHQEMMNHVINMGNHREPYQPHSKLSELHKTRPSTFAHTDRPLEADDWLRDIERKLVIA